MINGITHFFIFYISERIPNRKLNVDILTELCILCDSCK